MKKKDRFEWTTKCEKVFLKIKSFLTYPSILNLLREGPTLLPYLPVTNQTMSLVLVQETYKVERPMYFGSKVFKDAETCYQKIEKLMIVVAVTLRKLVFLFK